MFMIDLPQIPALPKRGRTSKWHHQVHQELLYNVYVPTNVKIKPIFLLSQKFRGVVECNWPYSSKR